MAILVESLLALKSQLLHLGQNLLLFKGHPVEVINNIVARSQVDVLGTAFHPGIYEQQQWHKLQTRHPQLQFYQHMGHCLFQPKQLAWAVSDLPETFTPFRKQMENVIPNAPCPAPAKLPPAFHVSCDYALAHLKPATSAHSFFTGGSSSGLKQLNYFLDSSHHVRHYKQTRNELDGWDYSSKLSSWLANGCLSSRQVYQQLKGYEQAYGRNESTYWLFFELLWREYFQWYLMNMALSCFHFQV